jgi:class 3 adenylate cyclase
MRTSTAQLMTKPWKTTDATAVPATADVPMADGAVNLTATYLYADLADSTELQKNHGTDIAARVIRMYLNGAAKLIRTNGGVIKSYDGDRVMGVFVGRSMRNDAVWAGMQLCWLVDEVICPLVDKATSDGRRYWIVTHGVGIDCGEAFVTRAGVRNPIGETIHNDLVSVGRAPAIAAKMSALRDRGAIAVTGEVYSGLNEARRFSSDGGDIWRGPKPTTLGPYTLDVYDTPYRWKP